MFSNKAQADRSAMIRAVCGLAALSLVAATPVARAQSTAEEIRITLGKSIVIDYPVDVARISTSNPEIVDAVAVSTREVLLHAKAHGICTIVVWSKTGQRTFYNISVEHNLEPIRRILKETFPNEPIQIQSARDSITLVGKVTSQSVADRATALAASLSKTVINNLQINPLDVEKQILLRVKFAELNRTRAHSFGVNLISTGALGIVGSTSTGQFSSPAVRDANRGEFSITDALNVFAFRPELNLATTIKALQTEGILQIIAEPNLVTTNGKEASFLVGGEFPIPILQGGANSGSVTVQFREFGIRLTFNPQLTSHSTLKMYVKPEVSTIDLANAVTLSGFTIPALATRRMETNIELGPGQSFVIGGLIDDRVTDQMLKIPGLASIPVLGSLFKSRNENKTKTELLVMVTPEIVDPLNPSDPKPTPVMPREFIPPIQIKPTSQKGNVDPVKAKARKLRAKESNSPATAPAAITVAQPAAPAAPAAEPAVDAAKDAPKTGGESH